MAEGRIRKQIVSGSKTICSNSGGRRGKLILLDQDALYRELKELVLSVSRGGV